jgi:Zn-dependent peptidase ImmA (M78 family)
LPHDYDLKKTVVTLQEIDNLMNKIKLPIKARRFNLKFKKLGIYKNDGFYSKELNTIIIEARRPEVFVHELGHLIYDNNIKISKKISGVNSEDYAKKFQESFIKEFI